MINSIFLGNYHYGLYLYNRGRVSYSKFYCYYALISCLGLLIFLECVLFTWIRVAELYYFNSDDLWKLVEIEDQSPHVSAIKFGAIIIVLNLLPLWYFYVRKGSYLALVKRENNNLRNKGHVALAIFVTTFLLFIVGATLLSKFDN